MASKRKLVLPQENATLRVEVIRHMSLDFPEQSGKANVVSKEGTHILAEASDQIIAKIRAIGGHDEGQLVAGIQQIAAAVPSFLTSIAAHDLVEPKTAAQK